MQTMTHLTTLATSQSTSISKTSSERLYKKAMKKARMELPENILKHKLDMCSRHRKLIEALQLYDEARRNGVQLSYHHYNVLLYLCSFAAVGSLAESEDGEDDVNVKNLGMTRGIEIYQQMNIDKVAPNEATFTNAARLAAAMEDPEMAFDLVKQMKSSGIPPRLRSYGPALFGFCEKGEASKAFDVDAHMIECGVVAEESELAALLEVAIERKIGEKVYEMLHRLRSSVRQVSESTAKVVEKWFRSDYATDVGKETWDAAKIKEGIVNGGGGWHGQGWLGNGRWRVTRTNMDMKGVCQSCDEKLVCIDIDPAETAHFAGSLPKLACQKESKVNFLKFEEWLRQHGPFDAVIDGANVGMQNQHYFSFFDLNSTVNQLRQLSPSKKLPLVILHRSRVHGGPAEDPKNRRLLQRWKESGALYATPAGSNDDWYWLYAAVSCNCLLVTNDEMRDHLFQLLGTSFFPRWKEKHQVRTSFSRGVRLHMPPPYSIIIQESENGSWHVPTVTGDDIGNPRQWLCATRARNMSARSPSLEQIWRGQ
ncbi:proteinaceous RNase P 1, chloroplastic/mitochondrial-like isoform X2 [Punica granatum]|nr:proteinaceous RNase P 1, chloroplastic/mitochondrial-like isoform X2 [Punica granatum]